MLFKITFGKLVEGAGEGLEEYRPEGQLCICRNRSSVRYLNLAIVLAFTWRELEKKHESNLRWGETCFRETVWALS